MRLRIIAGLAESWQADARKLRVRDKLRKSGNGTMTVTIGFIGRVFGVLAGVAALSVTGGCVSTSTYGTGVSAERQLVNDFTNIFSLGGTEEEEVVIEPRPDLVVPPEEVLAAGTVPAPVETAPDTELASVWPTDPEEDTIQPIIDGPMNDGPGGTYDERNTKMTVDQLNVVGGSSTAVVASVDGLTDDDRIDSSAPELNEEVLEKLRKKKKYKYVLDPNGVPVRRYLIEPPTLYRIPAEGGVIDEEAAKRRDKYYRDLAIAARAREEEAAQ